MLVTACGASPPPLPDSPNAAPDIKACLHDPVAPDTDVYAGVGSALVDTPAKRLGIQRLTGDAEIVPDRTSQMYLMQSDVHRISAIVRLCFDEAGVPYDVTPVQTSCIPRYDNDLVAALKTWRYAPYVVADKPVRVCTAVAFRYARR
jgi:hypothetical protein